MFVQSIRFLVGCKFSNFISFDRSFLSVFLRFSIFTLICFSVSRSRIVTSFFSRESWSIVIAYGVPSVALRRYLLPILPDSL